MTDARAWSRLRNPGDQVKILFLHQDTGAAAQPSGVPGEADGIWKHKVAPSKLGEHSRSPSRKRGNPEKTVGSQQGKAGESYSSFRSWQDTAWGDSGFCRKLLLSE